MRTPVTLSETAARRLHSLAKSEGRPLMLRVAVEGGGCSGFQYQFDLVEDAINRFHRFGAPILVTKPIRRRGASGVGGSTGVSRSIRA